MDIPSHGLILNLDGYSVRSPSVISEVKVSFLQPTLIVHIPTLPPPRHDGMVQLPPTLNNTRIVPPLVDSTNAGMAF